MAKISAVISVFNEEKNIDRCLKSLSFVNEIIVVDNDSTDNTAKIAKTYTNKIYKQKNNLKEIDLQKNFGFKKATGDWILSVDADEEISKELVIEIQKVINEKNNISGYWIPRKNIIFGRFIQYTGWYPDPQLRLFRNGMAKFIKSHVHEPIHLNGESSYLQENLIHHHYETILQFLDKTINLYVPNEAEEYLRNGYTFSFFDGIRFPLNEFLSRFFARKGYKDGFHGLMLSILMAFYHFLIFAYIWEKQGFKEYGKENFLNETEQEFKKATRDIFYWISKEKLEAIKNPLRKNLQKITNKFRNL